MRSVSAEGIEGDLGSVPAITALTYIDFLLILDCPF